MSNLKKFQSIHNKLRDLYIVQSECSSAAQELKIQAERLTGKKVKYLINSHYHGDPIFGNQAFKEEVIISTEVTKEWIKEKNAIGATDTELRETKQYLSKKQFKKS